MANTEKSFEYNTSLEALDISYDLFSDAPYSERAIAKYLQNPMAYNRQIRKLAHWAYRVNGSIASAVNYATSMHTLDYVVVCKSIRKTKNKKKPRHFEANSARFNQVLDYIRYKELFRDAIRKSCLDGTCFYYMEVSSPAPQIMRTMSDVQVMNIREINSADQAVTIIPLPVDYCKIVGRLNNSYVVAFNLRFFQGKDAHELERLLRGMPQEIRDAYENYSAGKMTGDNWIELDNRHTMVAKARTGMNEPWGEPLIIAALDDVLYARHFVDTKRNVLDRVNHQIIYQTFPEGAQKGTSALTEKQQEAQHNTVKQAVMVAPNRQGISFFSLPGGTKIDQVEVDNSIFEDDTETDVRDNVAVDIGIAPSVLTGKASGNYATSTLNVELFSSYIYTYIEDFVAELNKCMDACVINDSSCPVAMYMMPITFVNRDKFVEQLSKLYTSGKGSLTAWIAATGMNPTAYLSLMDHELEEDFEQKYPVHATSYNASASQSDEGGRPESDDTTISSSISTKANDSNNSPKPSV